MAGFIAADCISIIEPELFLGLRGIEPLVVTAKRVNLIRQTALSGCLPARRSLGAY